MSEALFPYYERELLFIRRFAQEFSKQYPAAAGRLLLEPNRSIDPHVERLIESFALLAGRLHRKIDDEFPELTDALLNVLYPHYLAPIPSMAVVQFVLDAARAPLPDGFLIDRQSRLRTLPVSGLACRYRTGYPARLWPVELTNVRLQPSPFPAGLRPPPRAVAALRFQLQTQAGMRFGDLSLDTLRVYLNGDRQLVGNLYELIFHNALQIVVRPVDRGDTTPPVIFHPRDFLQPVGFAKEEGLLPYPRQSFTGYRLLTEFFAFPAKFHFVDLLNLQRFCKAGFEKKLEVVIFVDRVQTSLIQGVNDETMLLGCTPVINLFEQLAEPISLTQKRPEYRIVPDVAYPLGLEVYSVDAVTASNPLTGQTTDYAPFYSLRHGSSPKEQRTFWYATRRASTMPDDRGSDMYLNTVDLDFKPQLPAESALVIRTTCTNRDLPITLQMAGTDLAFDLEKAAPLTRVRCVRSPSPPLRPPMGRGGYWRILSHLALNHLSLADEAEGRGALQEILRLYDYADPEERQQLSAVNRQLIEGISGLRSRRVTGRIGGDVAGGFCRGVEITVEFDPEKYIGTGVYLFASVLERFFGLYASINSFCQMVAKPRHSDGIFHKWPPRAGEMPLV